MCLRDGHLIIAGKPAVRIDVFTLQYRNPSNAWYSNPTGDVKLLDRLPLPDAKASRLA